MSSTASSRSARPAVAFVDESYDFTRDNSREPLYVLAAVLIRGEIDRARTDVRNVVAPEAGYHSTDLAHASRLDVVHEVLRHVRDTTDCAVVSLKSPFTGHANQARQACLRLLLPELSVRRVGHVVLDARLQPRASDPHVLDKQDLRTARQLRSVGAVHRHFTMTRGDAEREPLLWLPDAVAWSVRRALVADDEEHFGIVRATTTLLVERE